MWRPDGPVGFESRKIKSYLPKYAQGKVLEIGCGTEKAFPTYIGYDRVGGAANLLGDAAHLSILADGSFDTVFSSHCLEDFENPERVLNEWARVLKDGGNMILYLPSANFYPKMGTPDANPNHKNDFYPDDIRVMFSLTDYNWDELVVEERSGEDEYSIFAVYRKRRYGDGFIHVPIKKKTACVYRTGGFGDVIMAATVLPSLKKRGYHISFMTDTMGRSILKNNPYIDDLLIIDNAGLTAEDYYKIWAAQTELFDLWINMQNSVENALISFPYTVEYYWPTKMRHEKFNKNYFEFQFELADLPFAKHRSFFPTKEEKKKAKKRLNPDEFNIVFCLSGSALHKKTPFQDIIIGAILEAIPEARLFLVADKTSEKQQAAWLGHDRVECLCGKISIRETLTMAMFADVVIGPETAVLNAVCYDKVLKVIYLSHSSKENLTKHWKNTCTLEPVKTSCYPCHKLHYKPKTCNVVECGAAKCVASILPLEYIKPIAKEYEKWCKR